MLRVIQTWTEWYRNIYNAVSTIPVFIRISITTSSFSSNSMRFYNANKNRPTLHKTNVWDDVVIKPCPLLNVFYRSSEKEKVITSKVIYRDYGEDVALFCISIHRTFLGLKWRYGVSALLYLLAGIPLTTLSNQLFFWCGSRTAPTMSVSSQKKPYDFL